MSTTTTGRGVGGRIGRVLGVVIAYYPDPDFIVRLHVVLPQVDHLLVVDNTPQVSDLASMLSGVDRVTYHSNACNIGIAAALNQGLAKAHELECDWLLTLDQDTRCYPDMVTALLAVVELSDPECVVVGGNYLDPRNKAHQVKPGPRGSFFLAKTVITSGEILHVQFAKRIGGFRDDYFIDQVDHEFCLRVRAHGGRVVVAREVVMAHSVGESGGLWLPVLGWLPNHAAVRKYYIARNSLVTIANYWRIEPGWCLRRLVRLVVGAGLILLEPSPFVKVRAFWAGVHDAFTGRMGPYRSD